MKSKSAAYKIVSQVKRTKTTNFECRGDTRQLIRVIA